MAQANQKTQADKHRHDHKFKIGDMVYLSNRNLSLLTGTCKLSHRWIGPYKIIQQCRKDSFTLDLPKSFRIHSTFHTSLLRPYLTNNDTLFPDRTQDPPPPVIIDDQE